MNFKVRKNNNIFVCKYSQIFFSKIRTHNICRAKLTYFSLKWPAFRQISLLRGLKAPEGIKPWPAARGSAEYIPSKKKIRLLFIAKNFP